MIAYTNIEDHCLDGLRELMQHTPQDKKFHGEGDVLAHTLMVHDLIDVRGLSASQAAALKIAALMHDIGKVRTTQVNGEDITCPNHSQVGARMTREILWKKFGLAGTVEAISFRETVVNLVRYHGFPPHVLEDEFALAKMYRAATNNLLGATDFTMDMLYRLAKADMAGRVCQDQDDALAAVECFRDMAEEEHILNSAPDFVNYDDDQKYNLHKFLNFKTGNCINANLFNDTQNTVQIVCGLPGTGKDTFIRQRLQSPYIEQKPVISLDDIRKKLRLQPGDTNGIVIQTAKEQAKEYLRKQENFVWNATNLTYLQRKQIIDLCETYHTRVQIHYLETTANEQIKRNHKRPNVVPQNTIDEMIGKLQLPEFFEAYYVSWNVV